jgi:hypothetical protein
MNLVLSLIVSPAEQVIMQFRILYPGDVMQQDAAPTFVPGRALCLRRTPCRTVPAHPGGGQTAAALPGTRT